MNKLKLISLSAENTEKIACAFGAFLEKGAFVAIYGDLGAGKTLMSSFIFAAKGFTNGFSSPTFTVIKEYTYMDLKAYHLDVYRVEDCEELEYLGYYDCLQESVLTVVEWADKIQDALPDKRYNVHIKYLSDDKREIEISNDYRDLTELGESLNEYIGN